MTGFRSRFIRRMAVTAYGVVLSTVVSSGSVSAEDKSGIPLFSSELGRKAAELVSGELMFAPDLGPQLRLILKNKLEEPAWIRVDFSPPAPGTTCSKAALCGVNRNHHFVCTQDTILVNVKYPIAVTVFEDSTESRKLWSTETSLRFSHSDVAQLKEAHEASVLPRTYANVYMKEKIGLSTALSIRTGGAGALIVGPDAIEWSDGKKSLSVPFEQMREVSIRSFGKEKAKIWVVVRYEADGAEKTAAFQGSTFRSSPSSLQLQMSLQALLDRREP